MKPLRLSLFAAIVMSLVACGNVGKSTSAFELAEAALESVDAQDSVDAQESVDTQESVDAQEVEGSEDWDTLLQSYEQFVDKCIVLVKKAAKGDMSALLDYPALLQKTQELGEKLENAKGEMPASQLERFTKIHMKMLKATEEMSKEGTIFDEVLGKK